MNGYFSIVFMLIVISTIILCATIFTVSPDPGVAWKIPYVYTELVDIYLQFKMLCHVPNLSKEYLALRNNHKEYQLMRSDCHTLPDEEKYERLELHQDPVLIKSLDTLNDSRFLMNNLEPRLGSFIMNTPSDFNDFIMERIGTLMTRLHLPNSKQHSSDKRGATYIPAGGCMEYHSNQSHFGGWRLYMHYLPEGDEQKSWFAYKHPYDGTYRRIYDNNSGANMFRIRKKPNKLLWHCIYSDVPRFSMGIWLPPELAQHLKVYGERH